MSNHLRFAVRIVAAIQIAGSIAAVVLIPFRVSTWLSLALVALLVAAGLLGGIGAWHGTRHGYRLSLGVQAVQLLRLKAPAFTYLVNTGLVLAAGVQDGKPALTTGVAAGIYIGPAPDPVVFAGCNLAALASGIVLCWAATKASPESSHGARVATPDA